MWKRTYAVWFGTLGQISSLPCLQVPHIQFSALAAQRHLIATFIRRLQHRGC